MYLAASQRQEAAGRVRLARSSAKCVTAAVGAWSRDGPLTQGGRAETRMTADAFRQHDSVGVMALQLLLRFLTDFGISFEVNLLMYSKGHHKQRQKTACFRHVRLSVWKGQETSLERTKGKNARQRYQREGSWAELGLNPAPVSFWLGDFGQAV